MPQKQLRVTILLLAGTAVLLFSSHVATQSLLTAYKNSASRTIFDRNGVIMAQYPNSRGLYQRHADVPQAVAELFIEKEDRFFYLHPGINPLALRRRSGSSTITQQLVKNLLGNENNRTVQNKIVEAFYAVGLELWVPKSEILKMYLDTAYFGKGVEGVGEASITFFGKPASELSIPETVSLLSALSDPSRVPGTKSNQKAANSIGSSLTISETTIPPKGQTTPRKSVDSFEVEQLKPLCQAECTLTIDVNLTQKVREIVSRNLSLPSFANVTNGAVVIIKVPENELLAVIGSPDPTEEVDGHQINMATQSRAIGSTIKPFIYTKAFEKGARPYTLVDDREYQYSIGTGFPFYPKNFDGKYRGIVTLHDALSNSLNVPSVKTLEYVGTKPFGDFLTKDMSFKPLQPIEQYDLGIALGALEMDLLTLSHYFTVFPDAGELRPLKMVKTGGVQNYLPPMESAIVTKQVISKPHVEMVTKILSDRATGAEQFGLASNLYLPKTAYAVKTGTSRDYHDSWTMGYTRDFVVGVWVGNSDNTAMREVTGATGAGKIWNEVMSLMLASPYYSGKPFVYSSLAPITTPQGVDYSLPNEAYADHVNVLLQADQFITSIHSGEVFLLEADTQIPLVAVESVDWKINGSYIGTGTKIIWHPKSAGSYTIEAGTKGKITVEVRSN